MIVGKKLNKNQTKLISRIIEKALLSRSIMADIKIDNINIMEDSSPAQDLIDES